MGENYDEEYAEYRRKRVQRLKKIILATILLSILIPIVVAVIFIVLFVRTKNQLDTLNVQYEETISMLEQLRDEITYTDEKVDVYTVSDVVDSDRSEAETVETDIEAEEVENTAETSRKVYLTFDDGPSSNTARILDILAEYDVKATFFVVGKTDETSVAAYKRIVEEGHTLGMHSYSHKYSQIYESRESFVEDLNKLQEYLYEVTGVWSRYYRFPGGSSNTTSSLDMMELVECLDELDITYFDWNIVSGDASGQAISADKIYENCVSNLSGYSNAVILMHDAGNKDSTVDALAQIIEAIQAMEDTSILPITDTTEPVVHKKK